MNHNGVRPDGRVHNDKTFDKKGIGRPLSREEIKRRLAESRKENPAPENES